MNKLLVILAMILCIAWLYSGIEDSPNEESAEALVSDTIPMVSADTV